MTTIEGQLKNLIKDWQKAETFSDRGKIQGEWDRLIIENFPLNSSFYLGNLPVVVSGFIQTKAYGGAFLYPFCLCHGKGRLCDPLSLTPQGSGQLEFIPTYLEESVDAPLPKGE